MLVYSNLSSTLPMDDIAPILLQNLSFMSWIIKNTAHFKAQYKILPHHIQNIAKGVFETIEENPYDKILSTHKLRRALASYHGISVSNDYRIIARILDTKKEIILHDIGTHEIYKSFLG